MPVDERKLLQEIHEAGCSVKETGRHHYLVYDPEGNPIGGYAVRHPGKREIFDHYASKVRKALSQVKSNE